MRKFEEVTKQKSVKRSERVIHFQSVVGSVGSRTQVVASLGSTRRCDFALQSVHIFTDYCSTAMATTDTKREKEMDRLIENETDKQTDRQNKQASSASSQNSALRQSDHWSPPNTHTHTHTHARALSMSIDGPVEDQESKQHDVANKSNARMYSTLCETYIWRWCCACYASNCEPHLAMSER
jgi:hypothetical protein